MTKIAVIGWDAATFDVIFPLLEAGALPNLQHLMTHGAWGRLQSTIHPLSPTAWTSFMTGVNPGRHGVFDFVSLRPGGRFHITNGGAIGAETLWSQLSRAGRCVAAINVPMTYPPQPVNGVIISGMDAPRQDRAFTYPPEFASQLHRHFGSYREGVSAKRRFGMSGHRFVAHYIDQLCQVTRLHSEVAQYVLEHHPVDFLTIVFTAPDRAQHALGHLLKDGVTPDDDIGRVYRACDDALGRILKQLGDDWITMVISDHGARAYKRVFELSTWLGMRGWLRLQPMNRSSKLAGSLFLLQRMLARLTNQPAWSDSRLEQFLNRIVWSETRAFALGACGSIYINTREKFPMGIVEPGDEYQNICEQITEELLAVRDPDTGDQVVRAVHRAADVYEGDYAYLAPDLLIETTEDYFVRNNLDHEEGTPIYTAGHYRGRSLAHTGKHTPDGILIATGTPFTPGAGRSGARIVDIAPTILYLSGLPVPYNPSRLDGRPLLEWLDPDYCHSHPVRLAYPSSSTKSEHEDTIYSDSEFAAIESRLRDLGYM